MASNRRPYFVKEPLVSISSTGGANFIGPSSSSGIVNQANTAFDGTGSLGTTLIEIATVPAEGAVLKQIVATHLGTNIATVVRIFINNGQSVASGSNNRLFNEFTMPANTASQTTASTRYVDDYINQDKTLPGGTKIYASSGQTLASGIQLVAFLGGLAG